MSQRTFWDEPRASVFLCSECSETVANADAVGFESSCRNCSAALHSCRNCAYFDTAAESECRVAGVVRVSKKRGANECVSFRPVLSVDLTGGSRSGGGAESADPADRARRLLDDLFNSD